MSDYMLGRIKDIDEAVKSLGESCAATAMDRVGVRCIRQILRTMRERHEHQTERFTRRADEPCGIERGCAEA